MQSGSGSSFLAQLRAKGLAHWVLVLVLTALGVVIGHEISEQRLWTDVRYRIYQETFAATRFRGPLYPKRTALVLVQDDEYWKGELAGRAPIRRDYLARLVEKLDAANAAVIALDFDLRSPISDGSLVEHPAYLEETDRLRAAVKAVAVRRPVVLPAAVGFDADGAYIEQSSIFRGFDFGGGQVGRGYIQLPYDLRRVPIGLELADGSALDSFALAIVGAVDPTAHQRVAEQESEALPFASYMTERDFAGTAPTDVRLFSSAYVLAADSAELIRSLGHKIVIVGAAWSRDGYANGARVDLHPTPAGSLPGALVHANYVEAILNERTYKPLSDQLVIAFEVGLVLAVAVLLALEVRPLWKVMFVAGTTSFFIVLSYFFLQNLGMFFDFFVPVVVLVGHVAVEKVLHWRHAERYNVGHSPASSPEKVKP
jgi:CHASE2 domain-containing sensor protein